MTTTYDDAHTTLLYSAVVEYWNMEDCRKDFNNRDQVLKVEVFEICI